MFANIQYLVSRLLKDKYRKGVKNADPRGRFYRNKSESEKTGYWRIPGQIGSETRDLGKCNSRVIGQNAMQHNNFSRRWLLENGSDEKKTGDPKF